MLENGTSRCMLFSETGLVGALTLSGEWRPRWRTAHEVVMPGELASLFKEASAAGPGISGRDAAGVNPTP
jgi:hypothetical protein